MNFGIADDIAILVITVGPLKAAIVYARLTGGADRALRRAIAFRTVIVATIAVATYPLAMPLMATPQGTVALVTLAAAKPELSNIILLIVIILAIMGLNLVVLLSADKILGKGGGRAMQVVGRVVGLLLAGLAMQLMILGLTDLGLIPAAAQAHC